MNEPATNAVPSTTEMSVSSSRTLCAARLRTDTRRITEDIRPPSLHLRGLLLPMDARLGSLRSLSPSKAFIRSSTESAVGLRSSSTMRPSARNSTRSA